MADALDVDSSRGNIGCHQDVDLPCPEASQGLSRTIAVDRRRSETAVDKIIRQSRADLLVRQKIITRVQF